MTAAGDYDWRSFDLHYYYRAPRSDVWRAWATPDGLCSFFVEHCWSFDADGQELPGDAEFAPGGRYQWRWRHDFEGEGSIHTVEPMTKIGFSFGESMKVSVSLTETDDGVHVHLRQWDIPDSDDGRVWGHLNCRSCWIFFMTNLTSVLETGRDLRHDNPAVVSSMEVGFQRPGG